VAALRSAQDNRIFARFGFECRRKRIVSVGTLASAGAYFVAVRGEWWRQYDRIEGVSHNKFTVAPQSGSLGAISMHQRTARRDASLWALSHRLVKEDKLGLSGATYGKRMDVLDRNRDGGYFDRPLPLQSLVRLKIGA
jgi:hypothetical protein